MIVHIILDFYLNNDFWDTLIHGFGFETKFYVTFGFLNGFKIDFFHDFLDVTIILILKSRSFDSIKSIYGWVSLSSWHFS